MRMESLSCFVLSFFFCVSICFPFLFFFSVHSVRSCAQCLSLLLSSCFVFFSFSSSHLFRLFPSCFVRKACKPQKKSFCFSFTIFLSMASCLDGCDRCLAHWGRKRLGVSMANYYVYMSRKVLRNH
ncbi:hypothetical protein BCR44DRAFT_1015413 [Catenaria anguillulae PL171]|uniref:Uncharacterized protein n=1 Tax=Catenaria anguillulae PL171 TaxID=765915 RepID=A0A1Y2HTS4_9FUNG|nr:hypothetical protein BCR44DRAFT_1015413 [Catenaria anguillulae PL171]